MYEMYCLRYLLVGKPCLHCIIWFSERGHPGQPQLHCWTGLQRGWRVRPVLCIPIPFADGNFRKGWLPSVGCCGTELMTQNIHSCVRLPLMLFIVSLSQRLCCLKKKKKFLLFLLWKFSEHTEARRKV